MPPKQNIVRQFQHTRSDMLHSHATTTTETSARRQDRHERKKYASLVIEEKVSGSNLFVGPERNNFLKEKNYC